MKMLRRVRPDDSATEYPSPQQIAGSGSSGQEQPNADWGEIKENMEPSEIDAVIGCLASFFVCFTGKNGSSKASFLNWKTLTLLVVVCIGMVTYHSYVHKDAMSHFKEWTPIKAGITSMSAVTNFGTSRRLALGPEKKPVIAVISTHHRTGTVLFQNMGERLCETFLMDYERVDEPFKLSNPNATRTLLYQRYWNTTGRIAVGMHGFEESCEQGQDVGMYCDPLDYECWLDACVSIDQKPEEKEIPVAHVVRNPVEILISAYLYHQQDPPPEEWLYFPKPDALEILPMELQEKFVDVPYYKVLGQLPPELGILVEFTVENEEIYRMARNYRDMAMKPYAKNLHFEDFKGDFKGKVQSTLDHLKITDIHGSKKVMNIAMIFDLNNMPEQERHAYQVENHITEGKHNKDDLRQLLYNNATTRHMLDTLAQVMEYDTAFPSVKKGIQPVPLVTSEATAGASSISEESEPTHLRRSRKRLSL